MAYVYVWMEYAPLLWLKRTLPVKYVFKEDLHNVNFILNLIILAAFTPPPTNTNNLGIDVL